jgi:hypothetical protein
MQERQQLEQVPQQVQLQALPLETLLPSPMLQTGQPWEEATLLQV